MSQEIRIGQVERARATISKDVSSAGSETRQDIKCSGTALLGEVAQEEGWGCGGRSGALVGPCVRGSVVGRYGEA